MIIITYTNVIFLGLCIHKSRNRCTNVIFLGLCIHIALAYASTSLAIGAQTSSSLAYTFTSDKSRHRYTNVIFLRLCIHKFHHRYTNAILLGLCFHKFRNRYTNVIFLSLCIHKSRHRYTNRDKRPLLAYSAQDSFSRSGGTVLHTLTDVIADVVCCTSTCDPPAQKLDGDLSAVMLVERGINDALTVARRRRLRPLDCALASGYASG